MPWEGLYGGTWGSTKNSGATSGVPGRAPRRTSEVEDRTERPVAGEHAAQPARGRMFMFHMVTWGEFRNPNIYHGRQTCSHQHGKSETPRSNMDLLEMLSLRLAPHAWGFVGGSADVSLRPMHSASFPLKNKLKFCFRHAYFSHASLRAAGPLRTFLFRPLSKHVPVS